jgi:hypothetical protein
MTRFNIAGKIVHTVRKVILRFRMEILESLKIREGLRIGCGSLLSLVYSVVILKRQGVIPHGFRKRRDYRVKPD